jgi:hypothetical protein
VRGHVGGSINLGIKQYHACHPHRDRPIHELSGIVAQRYGISAATVRKWRERSAADYLDRPICSHRLCRNARDEERTVVCTPWWAANLALHEFTFVVGHFLPHLNRDSVWRILRAQGLARRPGIVSCRSAKGQGIFKDDELGFI